MKCSSSGPVFFLQPRLGKNGTVFNIYKFRTMVQGAENIGTGIFHDNNDTRITKIGSVLRKFSLDELPQLYNILKGEMSFVGPRPPVTYYPYMYEEYPAPQKRRFDFSPGITGLAQVRGRNSINWDRKILYDIEYIERFSLWLDLKIICLTIIKLIKMENIYRSRQVS